MTGISDIGDVSPLWAPTNCEANSNPKHDAGNKNHQRKE